MRRKLTSSAVLVVLGVAAAIFAAIALADSPQNTEITAEGPGQCAVGTAEIGHGNTAANSFATALTGSYDRLNGACLTSTYEKAAGNIRARAVLQKKSDGEWGSCRETDIYVNAVPNWFAYVSRDWGTTPCGNGAYRTKSYNHVKWDGSFHGGPVVSPNHSWPGG